MLQPQRSKLLGDLYYSDSSREYVPPPVKEIKALNQARETDYLLAKDNLNELETFKRNLPSQYSPEIYQNVIGAYNQAVSGINADNYADNVLDVKQIANDIKNKFGGQELLDQAKIVAAGNAELDAREAKGEIIDPEMKQYYRNRLKASVQPLSIDPTTGFVTKQGAVNTKIVAEPDLQKEILDVAKGWQENKNIVKQPDGRIKVLHGLAGQLGWQDNTFITEDELKRGLTTYARNNPKYRAYMEDYTNMKADKHSNPTGEDIVSVTKDVNPNNVRYALGLNIPKDEQGKEVNQPLTPDEINAGIQSQTVTPEQLRNVIKEGYLSSDIKGKIGTAVQKEGFSKIDTHFETDIIGKENRENAEWSRRQAIEEAAKKTPEQVQNDVTLVSQITSSEALGAKDVEAIKTTIGATQTEMDKAKAESNKYEYLMNNGTANYTPSGLAKLKDRETQIANKIYNLKESQKGIEQQTIRALEQGGFSVPDEYKKGARQRYNDATKLNAEALLADQNVKLDITPAITYKGNVPYTKESRGGKMVEVPVKDSKWVRKVGNNYYLNKGALQNPLLYQPYESVLFDKSGKPTPNIETKLDDSAFYSAPNQQQFASKVVDDYHAGTTSKWFGRSYKDDTTKKVYSNETLDRMNTIRDKVGDINANTTKPLQTIAITGAGNKDATKLLQNTDKAVKNDFAITPDKYGIVGIDGSITPLADYAKNKLGLPNMSSTYIDYDHSNFNAGIAGARGTGTNYGAKLKLTAKGKELAEDFNSKLYDKQGNVNLIVANTTNSGEFDEDYKKAYKQAFNSYRGDNSSTGIKNQHASALAYAKRSDLGRLFESMDLDNMSTNQKKSINVGGNNYEIRANASNASDTGKNYSMVFYDNNVPKTLAKDRNGNTVVVPVQAVDHPRDVNRPDYIQMTYESPDDLLGTLQAALLKTGN